jgi:hypothetical protein
MQKEFIIKGVLARYLDDDPLEVKRNFIIYVKRADSVIFKEFDAPAFSPGTPINKSIQRDVSIMPTKGKESRVREIEYGLKRKCKAEDKNLIELSYPDVFAEFEMIKIHLEKVYGKTIRKSYVFVERMD